MNDMRVAIIGGGLAGLNVARLLHRARVDVQLFEARDRFGGRILTVDAQGAAGEDGFDLGPSWFWPGMQPAIAALVGELDLPSFPQRTEGDVIFERMSREGPRRYPTPPQEPQSLRLAGGSAVLIRELRRDLPAERLHAGTPVTRLDLQEGGVRLTLPDRTVTAGHVIAALPPRLMQATMSFNPALPPETETLWHGTPTWMAPHAKVFAIYDRPFWREAGLSGTAQSMVGPMPEIHDATTHDGQPALFGFLGIGAAERARIGEAALIRACVDQFVRLFGAEAARPRATLYKDWAADPLTATDADPASSDHPAFAPQWVQGPWSEVLTMAGSETSPHEAGYLAGAVEASSNAAAAVMQRISARAG